MQTSSGRIEALRALLREGLLSTQEDLREKLGRQNYEVTQSTISRDLRKIGAMKAIDADGRTVYKLPEELEPSVATTVPDMVLDIQANRSMIVIRTTPGSASLIARHLDHHRPSGILGTIAGDDTIFIAPHANATLAKTIHAIRELLTLLG